MGKNKNRDRKQQQDRRQERGAADRGAEQQPSMEGQSQAMRPEGSPATARKGRQKSFGHN
ncbi:hypothetical protein ADL28_03305 [Streptomyces violaceusniger]|uniref:Small hydrophilic protein n=2 Tax=Streptomyces violaceusniger group TaxID=2839105 RepID=A0ABD5JFJ6_9ACTN|nr:hypothetical protein [Streptomyces violaceusniger]KUL66685.1 hypothetical protein ADL28_03305 [Streptomyces violaceusniger]MEE4587186.1 hypothetical protein [Streptomyces sp. DSM 41602]